MLVFIGLLAVWFVLGLFLANVINTLRVKNGNYNINDWVTVAMNAAIWGPVSILGAFSPEAKALGKTKPMLIGGVIGTIVFISIYQVL